MKSGLQAIESARYLYELKSQYQGKELEKSKGNEESENYLDQSEGTNTELIRDGFKSLSPIYLTPRTFYLLSTVTAWRTDLWKI